MDRKTRIAVVGGGAAGVGLAAELYNAAGRAAPLRARSVRGEPARNDPDRGRSGSDKAVPPRAQAAHQMASSVFANLDRLAKGKPLRDFTYADHGSLVSLSRFSTVGSLMGNLIGVRMAIEGRLARFVYKSLYRMHLIAVHGWIKELALMLAGRVNTILRPRLKLH